MRGKTLFILLVLVAVVAGALLMLDTPAARDGAAGASSVGKPLLPGLADELNDITAITVTDAEGVVSIRRDGSQWRVESKGGYPASFDTVRRTLIATSELSVMEAKTAKPELHARLGVEDPAGAGATSMLLTLQGADGKPVASLVVGHPGPGNDTLYVRRATEDVSWLVRGPLDVPRSATQWIDTTLPKLEASRVKSAIVTQADGSSLTVARETIDDAVWAVQDMGEGTQSSSPTAGRVVAASLESVSFEDVRPAADKPLSGEQQVVTAFTTFDGLHLTATSAVEDGKTWFTFAASADDGAEEAATTQAAELNTQLGPWVFAVPDYRALNLRKKKSDLVQPMPPPPAPIDAAPTDAAPDDEMMHGEHADEPPPGTSDDGSLAPPANDQPPPVDPAPDPEGETPADDPPH